MVAGRLDRRVQFERFTTSDNGFEEVKVWAAHGNPVWASKMDVSDAERWQAGQVQASVTTRFQIRYSAFSKGITPKDRLICEGETYQINGIKEIGRKRRYEITAARRDDL